MDYRDDIIETIATQEAEKICRKVIRHFRSIEARVFGDDRGLKSMWEEIAVQVQVQYTVIWGEYEDMVYATVDELVSKLPDHLKQALWLQTQPGIDWWCRTEDDSSPPFISSEIAHYIVREFVLSAAADASNARIRAFIERDYEYDGW